MRTKRTNLRAVRVEDEWDNFRIADDPGVEQLRKNFGLSLDGLLNPLFRQSDERVNGHAQHISCPVLHSAETLAHQPATRYHCARQHCVSQPPGSVYQFGSFQYDSVQRLLFRDGELVPLVPKAIDTLHALLERRGQVVGKAELMKAVWPDCVVEEVGLARNVSLLRKALGDDADAYIETIPKRGYRFAAEVDDPDARHGEAAQVDMPILPQHADGTRRTWLVFSAVSLGLAGAVYWQFYWPSKYLPRIEGSASLAVVPFECLSPDLDRESFSQGFAEALAVETSKLKSVQVISPGTVQRYRSLRIPTAVMARLLGLQVIVEGTAQRFGQQLRISVRLTDVHSGKLIWAERYDVAATDIGQAQATVAQSVAMQIGGRLSPQ